MVRFILGVILGVAAIVFIFQNPEMVQITFISWTLEISRALLVLIVLGIGIFLGWVGGTFRRRQRRRQR